MPKRDWLYGMFGAVFIAYGIGFVLMGWGSQGPLSILLGGIGVFITYSRLHPEINQQRWLRPIGSVWLLALLGVTILKLSGR